MSTDADSSAAAATSSTATSYSTDTSVLPSKNAAYGTQEYWEDRYTTEGQEVSFDWFQKPEQIMHLIEELIPKESRILMLGCGNSRLSEVMYDLGWENIVNIDYSAALIAQMKAKHLERRPRMEWHEMDIRKLSFEDDSFDIALDKGTMDALLTGVKDVWNPSEEVVSNCNAEVSEALRVLKPASSSRFIYLTFGQPQFRKRYVQREGWSLEVRDVGDEASFGYFLYLMKPL